MNTDMINAAALCEEMCDLSFLKNATVLITGATGLIGGSMASALLLLDDRRSLGLKLILPLRNPDRLKPDLKSDPRVKAFTADLTQKLSLRESIDYILHAASPTASRELRENSRSCEEFMTRSAAAMAELAREKQVKKHLYLSSMEVYGGLTGPVTEEMQGVFNHADPRSCYPISKLYGESLSVRLAQEGVPAVNVRLAQTFGEGISENENRVFAQFAASALSGRDIVLRTQGRSIGNYLHISDCVSALILLMEKGKSGETYNAAGDNCRMTIRELAQLTSDLLSGGSVRTIVDPAPAGSYPPDSAYIIDNSKLKRLGWAPKYDVSDMILSLGRDLKGERA